LCRNI